MAIDYLRSPHQKTPVNWHGMATWVPYAWDETSATTDWTCPDSTIAKEHYVLAHNYYSGIPVSSIGVVCTLYKSGVGALSGAVIPSLWVDDAWVCSSSDKIRASSFSITAFSHVVNDWVSPSSHTISFRWRASNPDAACKVTKAVNQLYDFYVKGR